jgi:hypothetical protein
MAEVNITPSEDGPYLVSARYSSPTSTAARSPTPLTWLCALVVSRATSHFVSTDATIDFDGTLKN